MIGHEPLTEKITLTLGADFTHRINADPGDVIPPGSTARICFYPPGRTDTLVPLAEWAHTTITDRYVYWRVESELADLIPKRAHFRVYINYPDNPTLNHCWYVGDVTRKQ